MPQDILNQRHKTSQPKFRILAHPNPNDLQQQVAALMEEGWLPSGGLVSHIAMVKESPLSTAQPVAIPLLCQAMELADEDEEDGDDD